MKKLLLISQHFPPEIGAASNRMDHVVKHLAGHDYHIYLVTAHPSYPDISLYKGVSTQVDLPGLSVYRSPVLPFSSGKWGRLLNQLLFLVFALVVSIYVSLRYSVKTCLTTSPPFLVNLVGFFLAIVWRRHWVMEIRDLWPDSMVAVNAISDRHPLFVILKKMELLFYRVSDHVVVVTRQTKQLLIRQGIPSEKVSVITNGIPDWIVENRSWQQDEATGKKPFRVVYIGNIGLSQNLELLLDAAHILRDDPLIEFHLVGEGLDKAALLEKRDQLRLDHVHFHKGIIDKHELIRWYQQADLGVVSLRDCALFKTVIPSKIYEYAASGVPILFLGEGEAAELIESYQLGEKVRPRADVVAEKIRLLKNKLEKRTTGANHLKLKAQRQFMSDFSWTNLIQEYREVLEKK